MSAIGSLPQCYKNAPTSMRFFDIIRPRQVGQRMNFRMTGQSCHAETRAERLAAKHGTALAAIAKPIHKQQASYEPANKSAIAFRTRFSSIFRIARS